MLFFTVGAVDLSGFVRFVFPCKVGGWVGTGFWGLSSANCLQSVHAHRLSFSH